MWLNKSALTLIITLTLAPGLGAHAAKLDSAIKQAADSLTLKSMVFEVGDTQKVEAESGQLMVPETRGNTRAKLIALAFIRFKSTSQKPSSPIVYLAGGPGDSGINDFRGVPLSLLNEMRAVADVIALDQRATGESEPRNKPCRSEQSLPLNRPGDTALFASIFRERMRKCGCWVPEPSASASRKCRPRHHGLSRTKHGNADVSTRPACSPTARELSQMGVKTPRRPVTPRERFSNLLEETALASARSCEDCYCL